MIQILKLHEFNFENARNILRLLPLIHDLTSYVSHKKNL